jgi:hypothetical protein
MLDVARNMIATWWQHGGGGRRSADFFNVARNMARNGSQHARNVAR